MKLYAQSMYHYACQYDVSEGRVYRGASECPVDVFSYAVDDLSATIACAQPSSAPQVVYLDCASLCYRNLIALLH